jgi:hypothetical protein
VASASKNPTKITPDTSFSSSLDPISPNHRTFPPTQSHHSRPVTYLIPHPPLPVHFAITPAQTPKASARPTATGCASSPGRGPRSRQPASAVSHRTTTVHGLGAVPRWAVRTQQRMCGVMAAGRNARCRKRRWGSTVLEGGRPCFGCVVGWGVGALGMLWEGRIRWLWVDWLFIEDASRMLGSLAGGLRSCCRDYRFSLRLRFFAKKVVPCIVLGKFLDHVPCACLSRDIGYSIYIKLETKPFAYACRPSACIISNWRWFTGFLSKEKRC